MRHNIGHSTLELLTVNLKTQFQSRLVFVQAVVASSFLSHAANNHFFFRDEFFGFSSFLISILSFFLKEISLSLHQLGD